MSRHHLRADELFVVVVGYDDPLDTFYAQVFDQEAGRITDDDVLLVALGYQPREITTAQEVIDAVRAYVTDVPDGLAETLEAERARRNPPTEFQAGLFKVLTGEDLP